MSSYSLGGEEPLRLGQFSVVKKRRLAEGGFGFVDLVVEQNMHKEYVLKRCSVQRPEDFEIVNKEVQMLNRFKTKHIVELQAYHVVEKGKSREALLLMEFCSGGHLLDEILSRNNRFYEVTEISKMFGQCLLAVQTLHDARPRYVVHRDIKLENFLMRSDGSIVLCDFGSVVEGPVYVRNQSERSAAEDVIQRQTTQMYRAPELVDLYMREELTEKSDIWSLGCILYTLCFMVHPFQDQGSLAILNENLRIPTSRKLDPSTDMLLRRMMEQDPEARPVVAEAIEACKLLAQGQPITNQTLPFTEEAQQRKEERRQRAIRRAKKKEEKPIVPPRAPTQLAPDSVAARRLRAAGQPIAPAAAPQTALAADFSFEVDFGEAQGPTTDALPSPALSTSMFDAAFGDSLPPASPAATMPTQAASTTTVMDAQPPPPATASDFAGFSEFTSPGGQGADLATVLDESIFDAFDGGVPDPPHRRSVGSQVTLPVTTSGFDEFDVKDNFTADFDAFDTKETSASTTIDAPQTPPAAGGAGTGGGGFDAFSPAAEHIPSTPAFPDTMPRTPIVPAAAAAAPEAPIVDILETSAVQSSHPEMAAAVAIAERFGTVDTLVPERIHPQTAVAPSSSTGMNSGGMGMTSMMGMVGGNGMMGMPGDNARTGVQPLRRPSGFISQWGGGGGGGAMGTTMGEGPIGVGGGGRSPTRVLTDRNASSSISSIGFGNSGAMGMKGSDPFGDLNAFKK